uniref:Bloodthirsty-related gene family, member 2 n=1 Tax=Paramormyrops kingsleyae TaxID=1676925 RepID=A0A3B3SRH0_9TELE
MASSGTLMSEEQFKCFICSNVFTSPVSTPCGHSFCISCINKFWDCSEILRCPKCEEIFLERPELRENTFAKEMVEQFKKRTANGSETISPRPEVPCDMMEEKQKAAEQRTKGLIEELGKEIAELHKRYTELEELSQTEDHIYFLQVSIHQSICIPQTKSWSDITVHSELFVGTVRSAVSRLESLLKMQEIKLCEKELMRISQYAVNVTLDPKTANAWLVMSVDGKQVKDGNSQQHLPDTPERFDTAPIVLGKESFSSGRHYWEVEVGQKTAWDLGVASASVKRKGVVRLTPQDGYWTVCLRRMNEYRACADEAVMLTVDAKPQKVGLYVDYEAGQVSFYNVEAKSHIYTFHGCIFTEKILPFFNPDLNDNGDNEAPLVISPVSVREEGVCL